MPTCGNSVHASSRALFVCCLHQLCTSPFCIADYGFEYSEEEQAEEDVDIENQYYNSKGMLENDDPRESIEGFNQVLSMEEKKGEWYVRKEHAKGLATQFIFSCALLQHLQAWGFKALKQLVKVYFRHKMYDKMMVSYRCVHAKMGTLLGSSLLLKLDSAHAGMVMLEYIDSAVTRNASEKKINSLLDFMAQAQDIDVLQVGTRIAAQSLAVLFVGDTASASWMPRLIVLSCKHAFLVCCMRAQCVPLTPNLCNVSGAHRGRLQRRACIMSVQEFYETTLKALEKAKNDRLWFKTNLKLANLWFKKGEYGRMAKIVKDLHA
eukprot:1156532-Pelagomonas_calceolata.AAC.14